MKKIFGMFMTICIIFSLTSMVALAADGSLHFTDVDATQGHTVQIEGVVRTNGQPIGDVTVDMTYDANALEFVTGDNVTGEAGVLHYNGSGDSNISELRFSFRFNVLVEGQTGVQVTAANCTLTTGEVVNLSFGNSTINALPGDGTVEFETPSTEVAEQDVEDVEDDTQQDQELNIDSDTEEKQNEEKDDTSLETNKVDPFQKMIESIMVIFGSVIVIALGFLIYWLIQVCLKLKARKKARKNVLPNDSDNSQSDIISGKSTCEKYSDWKDLSVDINKVDEEEFDIDYSKYL